MTQVESYREKSFFFVCKELSEKICKPLHENIMMKGGYGFFFNLKHDLKKSILWVLNLRKISLVYSMLLYYTIILYNTILLYYYSITTLLLHYIDMLFISPFSLQVANLCNFSLQIFADKNHFSLQGV